MRKFQKQDDFLIAPSLLSADFSCLKQEVQSLEAQGADALHWDVMDGHFVDNITFGPHPIKHLRSSSDLIFDVHLMIENPQKYLDSFIEAGADYLTVHIETLENPESVLKKIREKGVSPGITLRPSTPLSHILPFLDLVDLVLIMTVEPGFGGQDFLENQVQKISQLRKIKEDLFIEVDGGINDKTALCCKEADILVSGSYVFQKTPYSNQIEKLQNIKKGQN